MNRVNKEELPEDRQAAVIDFIEFLKTKERIKLDSMKAQMKWENVREKYPDSWVLIEAIEADSVSDERIIRKLAVLNCFKTCNEANARL